MAGKFPEYKYGGKKSDYEINYRVADSGKIFKSIVVARKDAIRYNLAYRKHNPMPDRWGNPSTWKHDVCWIDAINFHKYNNGTDITYRQQSGKTKAIGYVLILNDVGTNHKDVFYWIDKVKKADSRVIDKNGNVVRKLTAEEKRRF